MTSPVDAAAVAIGTAVLGYTVYELVTWYYGIKNPPPPYKDEDPVLGKTATVIATFTSSAESSVSMGSVELNGTTWAAEARSNTKPFEAGVRCRVSGRDGLRLIVEAVSHE